MRDKLIFNIISAYKYQRNIENSAFMNLNLKSIYQLKLPDFLFSEPGSL